MDLSKFLSGSSDGGNIDESDENKVSEGAKEGQWRDRLYKRKGINFTTNTKETRTLRSMQVHERRKSSRQSKQIAVRGIEGDLEDLDENDENIDNENNTNKIKEKVGSKKVEPFEELPKSKSRREKLAEYLEQKKKLEDQKRKMAKPAFKAGLLHHPLAPIGAGFHKPNIFSTYLNNSKSMTPSTSKVAPKRPVQQVKPVKKVATTTAAVTGRVTKSKAAGKKKDDRITNQPVKTQKTPVFASKTTSFAPNNFEFRPKLRLQPVEEECPAAVIRELVTYDTVSQHCQDELSYGESVDIIKGAESSKIMLTDDATNEKKEFANGNTEELVPIVAERITRRRSRRISGVKPDPALTQEELCVTPARRAKERSVSRDRRSSQCQMCPGDRTCATPRITRKSTLPAVDESDTKDYVDMDDKPVVMSRSSRRTRREAKLFQLVVENIESTEESRSDLQNNDCMENIPDKLNDLVGIAIEVPLPITEKKSKSSRRLNSQPIEEKVEFDSPMTNLSDSMDKVGIESTKKVPPTFKTPLKTARVAGIKSASKIAISPVQAGALWVSTSRGSASSKRKRKMNSSNNSVSAMFENLEGSPLLSYLEQKAMSNENISEADFEEIPADKQMKLDADFEVIALEDSGSSNLEEPNITYFRNLLMSETARITITCEKWEEKLKENLLKIPEEIQGEIRSVIGQGRLVMKERFTQFSRLVDNCEFKKGEKETTCTDLMGFWEMIYFQVEDVDKKFKNLTDVEANNWIEMVVQPVLTKKKIKTKTAVVAVGPKKVSSGLKALIAAKRKAAKEAKSAFKSETEVKDIKERQTLEIENDESQVQAKIITEEPTGTKRLNIKEMIARKREQLAKEKAEKLAAENSMVPIEKPLQQFHVEKTFDGGFFAVKSPVRSTPSSKEKSSAEPKRKSMLSDKDKLRKSVLMESARRRSGLVSPFVSQVARRSLQGAETSLLSQVDKRKQEVNLEESSKYSVEGVSSSTPVIQIVDPIAPLSSPVTKTYGKTGVSPAAKQRQIDAFDEMMLGKGSKLEPSVDSDIQLISFSPTDPSVPFEPEVPNSEGNLPLETPVTKSQIIVKTPARRSTRGKTPKKV